MKVRELMTEGPTCVMRGDTIRSAAEKMLEENVGALPVISDHINKELVGMITDRDIAVRAVAEGKNPDITVATVMTREHLVTAHPDDDANTLLKMMSEHQVRRVPVLDEHNRVVGIVAQADIAMQMSDRKAGDVIEDISKPGGQHSQ